AELEARKGFGTIWALFVMHCFYPQTYPLFDQHVYRAYRSIVTLQKECPVSTCTAWADYTGYRNFFLAQVEAVVLPYWEVDRALWAFGKHIKQFAWAVSGAARQVRGGAHDNTAMIDEMSGGLNDEWVHSTTFGGKAKSFWWKIDSEGNLSILRFFKSSNGVSEKFKRISREEIEKLNLYMAENEWVSLANNVEKLGNGVEKEGIGRFLYENFKWNIADCQLASHLGVIFSLSGMWEYNGKERGILFRRLNRDWRELVKDYYVSQ
ncbi:MAG: hypothetical protein PHT62_13610, partial [Desulfotomaculaceae bacterium]|nr:hypothetical protein [Desulfotomaculaceae bacterium]